MPFSTKEFPSAKELDRVSKEHEFYKFYKSDVLDSEGTSDRAKFRLKEFFENDSKKAKILDIALNLAPVIVDAGTDFTFGKLPKVQCEDQTVQKAIDEIILRNQLLHRVRDSATLFQAVGRTQFKLHAQDNKAFIDEVPYHYWFPNWSGVPVGRDSDNPRIVSYLSDFSGDTEKKYIYVEDYYLENAKLVIAHSLWEDNGARIGAQVPLTKLAGLAKTGMIADPVNPLTMLEKPDLDILPFVVIQHRKNVMERDAESILHKVRPLLYEVNDRLTQVSIQFLKHLNAKLQIPDGAVTRDKDGKVAAVNLEVFLARQGEEAKYITNDNPLIEQAFTHLEKVIRKIAKLTQTPDTFLTEDEKGGVEKAEALRTRLFLFISRIERYQQIYEAAILDMVTKALKIEKVDTTGKDITVKFESSMPKDWEHDVTVWGEAKAMGLASRERSVSRFQNIEGEELAEEIARIEGDEQKQMETMIAQMEPPDEEPEEE